MLLQILIQLASGAAGGNLAGTLLKKLSLGPIGNSLVGILGGGIGGQIVGLLGLGGLGGGAEAAAGLDLNSIISSVAGGGVGGGVLLAIVGAIKSAMKK